jgi:hypothetical protein
MTAPKRSADPGRGDGTDTTDSIVSTGGAEDVLWVDADAGPLVRLYAISNGRTRPRHRLELLSHVAATGWPAPPVLGPEHLQALEHCQEAVSVSELAGRLALPVTVTKIVVCDLIDTGTAVIGEPAPIVDPTDLSLLEMLRSGLQRL